MAIAMETNKPLVGIDYGSKLAGTTAIAWSFNRQEVSFVQSKKGEMLMLLSGRKLRGCSLKKFI
jgi:hypothetical protein